MSRILLTLLALCASCSAPQAQTQPVCTPQSTRCNGTNAEICAPSGEWVPLLRCDDLRPGYWQCGEIDGATNCIELTDASETP